MWQVTKELLLPLRHMMHGRTSKALGTVETSNHSNQTKAPLKTIPSKVKLHLSAHVPSITAPL